MLRLIIIGGGDHARVVADAVRTTNGAELAGFVDPVPMDPKHRLGLRQFASDDEALREVRDVSYILGIGGLDTRALRRRLVAQYDQRGARWHTVVHGAAWVSPSAVLAKGAVVLAGAVVNSHAVLGAHAVVNSGAVVEHDVRLGDFAFAAPGAVLGGGAQVGEECFLGLGCRIRDHVMIGDRSVVGMGAVVVESIPADVEVLGVPARLRQKAPHGNHP
jgi:acetyltransferase EpsM